MRIWDIINNQCVNLLTYGHSIISLAFHPSGDYIAVGSGPNIHIWEWNKPKQNLNFDSDEKTQSNQRPVNFSHIEHNRNVRAVIFHPNGNYLFAAAPDSPKLPNDAINYCRYFF